MTGARVSSPAIRPAILMGGAMGNALSVARSLGRRGVPVYLLGDSPDVHSRFARQLNVPEVGSRQESWARFLLGPEAAPLYGAVLLSCSDAGLEVLIDHRAELASRYVLDVSDPVAQRTLLDKLSTYEAAREAGVPTPRFWTAASLEEVLSRQDDYVYPLMVKPLYSHRFQAVFGCKFFRARDIDELAAAYERTRLHGLEVVILEEIPGPDDRLCSYYTYLDEHGEPLADFTKRIVRRFPENQGLACYHVTDWNPEVRDLGLRLFRHVGLRGVGNVEFKRDVRDGQPQGDRVQRPLHSRQSAPCRERLRSGPVRLQPPLRPVAAATERADLRRRSAPLVPAPGRPCLPGTPRQGPFERLGLARQSRAPPGRAVLQLG